MEKVIVGALNELGVGTGGESIDAEDVLYGLECFNTLIDALKAVRLGVWETRRAIFAMGSAASYTVGPGGDWDTGAGTTRPEVIIRAGFVNTGVNPTGPLDTPIHIYTDEEWAAIGLKNLTSTISWGIWYQTGVPLGTIFVYPILSGNVGDIALYLPVPLNEVSEDEDGLQTELVVPPGYRRMFRTNLAVEMADAFNIAPSAVLLKKANDSMRVAMKANIKPATLRLPRGLLSHGRYRNYNILTNQGGN